MSKTKNTKTKHVHWKLTVEEYTSTDSPEAWTSSLPSTSSSPQPSPPDAYMYEALPAVSTPTPSPPSPMRMRLPPTPHPRHDLPLPPVVELHSFLTTANALQLDFSFPSAAFRANPQLTAELLNAPACTPPREVLRVRIAAGAYKAELEIKHTQTSPSASPTSASRSRWRSSTSSSSRAVTVGDVLGTIQHTLRQPDSSIASDPRPRYPTEDPLLFAERRILTVNGYCVGRPLAAQHAHIEAERASGPRVIDRLLGHTQFAGLSLIPSEREGRERWQLELKVPPRYYQP